MKAYERFFTAEYLMGPNCVRLLCALLAKRPDGMEKNGIALDLGCGKGLTSYITAKETGYKVYANDLWISGEENRARFEAWGMGEQLIPVHEDANDLHFEKETFDLIVSVDSYHYFAGEPGFFAEKILPFMKPGAAALIAVPGVKDEYRAHALKLLTPWLGEEAYMLRSPSRWREIIGEHEEMAGVEIWEMDCFDAAWADWLAIAQENSYAAGDLTHYETIIKPYTNFVGMMIRKR